MSRAQPVPRQEPSSRRATGEAVRAFQRRNAPALARQYAASAKVKLVPAGVSFEGGEGVHGAAARLFQAFPDLRLHVEHTVVDEGRRRSAVEFTVSGRPGGPLGALVPRKATAALALRGLAVSHLDPEGRIVDQAHYFDMAEVLSSLKLVASTQSKLGRARLIFRQAPGYVLKGAAVAALALVKQALGRGPGPAAIRPTDAPDLARMPIEAVAGYHIDAENQKDEPRIAATVGRGAIRWRNNATGHDFTTRQAVADFYRDANLGLPDARIEIRNLFSDPDGQKVVAEFTLRGTHTGNLSGLPPTGRAIEYQGAVIYTFDEHHRIQEEAIFMDSLQVLHAMGLIADPTSPEGLAKLIR